MLDESYARKKGMNYSLEKLKSFVEKRATSVLTQTHIPRLDILRVCQPTEFFPDIDP